MGVDTTEKPLALIMLPLKNPAMFMLPSVSKANGGSAIAPTCLRMGNVRIPTPSGPMVMSDVNDETMTDKKDAAEDEAEDVPGYGPGMYTPQRLIPAVAFDQPGCVTCMQQ